MSYLGVFSFVLKVVWLFWMISYWVLFKSTMNWVFYGEIMERKIGFLDCIEKMVFQWWEKFTGRVWNNHHYYQYVGSLKFGGTWWKKLLVLWVIGWIMGSLWIFCYMNSRSFEKRREILASMCDERARMLQDQFNVSMSHVQALAILISTFHHGKNPSAIDQKTFAWYTDRTSFERPLTRGVAYAQKVLHSEREQFEKQQGWTIKRMDKLEQSPVKEEDYSVETQEPSPIQEEYAPVIFAQDTISHVISLDLMSGTEDRENILRARALGMGVLTAPFRLLKYKRLGVILTFAVYKSMLPPNATTEERIQATDGYLGGVFDIESLVEKLLHQLASKQTILVNVYDTTDSSNPISMYGSNDTYNVMFHVSTLDFGDPSRKHEMHCRFKQKPPLPWLGITTSFGALVIALLLGHIFHATMNRIAKVEGDYCKMMELKKRAEAADVAKSQFLATVSHEIRTPMNGVLGMLQMLMDTNLDITQQDYVRTAQASGKALVSLINQVLDQAKIEAGKFELESVQFDLRAILDDVLSLFSENSEKRIELAVYVSDRVPEILTGDPGRFRQIITNLVGNSIKFTEKGHIFVTVHLVEEVTSSLEVETEVSSRKNGLENSYNTLSGFPVADKRRSWENFKACNLERPQFLLTYASNSSNLVNLLISVEDTGIGIPQEAQSRVFTPFMQVRPSVSRIHGGTGIGLSISKYLVERMKGEIGFVSEPQIGSTFTFTASFTIGHTNSNQKMYNQSSSLSAKLHGLKALVIDPRSARARVTKYHLERLGIQVEIFSDKNHSLSNVTRGIKVLDMVFVDKEACLKDSNFGPTLVNNLTKNGRTRIPKLFLLANSICSAELNATKTVVFVLIRKPLRASMLAASLHGALGVGNEGNCQNIDNPFSSLKNLLYGKNILVVDDNLVNLRVAAGALKKNGAQVTCVESGKKALSMLKPPHDFDACFMDIQMPGMDGFEATRRIRDMEREFNAHIEQKEASRSVHVPILAMTADVIQATHEECTICGMDGYVSKPFNGEQLCREVERFFKSTTEEALKRHQE